MTVYCDDADLVLMYGSKNINRWADLDGDNDTDVIADRKEWARELATEYINSRLMKGAYDVPFASVPTLVVNLAAMYAGILLYDGRQVVSSEQPHDQVSRQRKDFDRYIRQILKGQLKLLDPTTSEPLELTSYNAPLVVLEDEEDEVTESDCCG